MSAGDFITTTYEATYDTTARHPIRVQTETATASIGGVVNGTVGGVATNPIQARVSGGKRTIGLIAKRVRMKLAPSATPPDGGYTANSTTVIPALRNDFYAAATKGAIVNYLGTTWTVTSRVAEVPE